LRHREEPLTSPTGFAGPTLPVEEGCGWLPVLQNDEDCLGAAAFRPNQFSHVFAEVVRRILDFGSVRGGTDTLDSCQIELAAAQNASSQKRRLVASESNAAIPNIWYCLCTRWLNSVDPSRIPKPFYNSRVSFDADLSCVEVQGRQS